MRVTVIGLRLFTANLKVISAAVPLYGSAFWNPACKRNPEMREILDSTLSRIGT
jgi:hypothetical protein